MATFIHTVRLTHFFGSSASQYRGILAILLQKRIRRPLGRDQVLEREPIFFQAAHGLGHLRDNRLRYRWQRVAQRIRQPPFIQLARQLRLAQLNQQIDQCLVTILPQSKHPAVHFRPIF